MMFLYTSMLDLIYTKDSYKFVVMQFQNRSEAGRILSEQLSLYRHDPRVIVLALPRGGVETAAPIAAFLEAPLDVFLIRKIGYPGNQELAVGAIAEDGTAFFSAEFNLKKTELEPIIEQERLKIEERKHLYRNGKNLPDLCGKIVVLVDDGIATGATMKVAIQGLKKKHPARIIIAVPVASSKALTMLKPFVDECIILYIPSLFYAVGQFYETFEQTTDEKVIQLLEEYGMTQGGRKSR